MSAEQKQRTKVEMSKRGLHPSGRRMTDMEIRLSKMTPDQQRKTKEYLYERGIHPSGRPFSQEELRKKTEAYKNKEERKEVKRSEKGKFPVLDN